MELLSICEAQIQSPALETQQPFTVLYLFLNCLFKFYLVILLCFKNFKLIFCMYRCFACMYMSVPHDCSAP